MKFALELWYYKIVVESNCQKVSNFNPISTSYLSLFETVMKNVSQLKNKFVSCDLV